MKQSNLLSKFLISLLSGMFFVTYPLNADVDVFFQPNFYSYQFIEKDLIQGYRNRNSSQVYRIGTEVDVENEFAKVEIQASFFSNPGQENGIYLGREAYLAFPIQGFTLNIGRKSFTNKHPLSKTTYTELDGTEGVSLDVEVWENIYWQISLWDSYRAYPIWEYNQTAVYDNLLKEEFRKGERSRHGTNFLWTSQYLDFTTDFYYINFGDWGRYASDDLNLQRKESGDGDFYHRTRIGLVAKWEGFRLSSMVHIARGLDKTFADPKRPERSLPIRGEAAQLEIGYFKKHVFTFLSGFVPNTMQTASSDQATTIGYVGMGNSPLAGAFLTRTMNVYPSAWVTEFGLESIQEIKGRRSSSFLGRWGAGYVWDPIQLSILIETLVPRIVQREDRGEISLRKVDYAKQTFSEATARIEYIRISAATEFHFGMELSYLWTSKEVGIEGTGVRFYGGVLF